jgi:VIT1/CCC1 family predicted Fe2+/Mn2+ transporter
MTGTQEQLMMSGHKEGHFSERVGWLRAAVLGANDGIVSVSSLVVGVAAAESAPQAILLAGIAGLVAGAISMAAGEFVSVSSQYDSERADIERERQELADDPEGELEELAGFYVARGLEPALAMQVAEGLTQHDALGAHMRDELGLFEVTVANPIQAAIASAAAFSVGAILPIIPVLLAPSHLIAWVVAITLAALAALGVLSAYIGGASVVRATWRVTFWGAFAMGITALIGMVFGVSMA